MATAKALQDTLKEVMTCCICNDMYKDPRILPCVHTFCLTCLQRVGTQDNKKPGDVLPCPICRLEFTIPLDGLAAVQKNFFMVRLVEIAVPQQGVSSVGLCDKYEHKNRLSDLSSAADILHFRIQNKIDIAKCCISDALKKKERLTLKKITVLEKANGIEKEVLHARSHLVTLIHQHADSVLRNLGLHKQKAIQDILSEEKELEQHLASLENVEKRCTELTSDVRHERVNCMMAEELIEKMYELERISKSTILPQLRSFDFNFTKTVPASLEAFRNMDSVNLVGKVEEKVDYRVNPELVGTIGAQNWNNSKTKVEGDVTDFISGMSVSGNKVFIVNRKSPVISMYDSDTLKYMSSSIIPDFLGPVDLGQCASVDGSVYIVNGILEEVFCLDRSQVLSKLMIKCGYSHISISDESTIVAASIDPHTVREYSLNGNLLRETEVRQNVGFPLHAIKLRSGGFVIGYSSEINGSDQLCMVNEHGDVTKYFGDSKGSGIEELLDPTQLAVDEDENILVLDRDNVRVLLLGPDLEFKRELLTEANGLRVPVAMHLDKKTGRLYIADNKSENLQFSDGRVIVFKVK